MPNAFLIRELRPEDVQTVCDIAVAAWEPIYAWYRNAMGEDLFLTLHPDWQAEKAGQVRRACQPDSPAHVLVAEQDGRVVAFLTMYANANRVGEIGNNAVHPDCQGEGIGPRLYEQAFAYLRGKGMRYVRVSTGGDPSHARARKAYAKAGFDIELPNVTYYRAL